MIYSICLVLLVYFLLQGLKHQKLLKLGSHQCTRFLSYVFKEGCGGGVGIQIDNSSQSFQESDTMNLILIFFFQVCLLVC